MKHVACSRKCDDYDNIKEKCGVQIQEFGERPIVHSSVCFTVSARSA